MQSTNRSNYKPLWSEGTQVQLIRKGHPQAEHLATVIRVLPNPSQLPENQWYDVAFGNGVLGRFLQRYLKAVDPAMARTA